MSDCDVLKLQSTAPESNFENVSESMADKGNEKQIVGSRALSETLPSNHPLASSLTEEGLVACIPRSCQSKVTPAKEHSSATEPSTKKSVPRKKKSGRFYHQEVHEAKPRNDLVFIDESSSAQLGRLPLNDSRITVKLNKHALQQGIRMNGIIEGGQPLPQRRLQEAPENRYTKRNISDNVQEPNGIKRMKTNPNLMPTQQQCTQRIANYKPAPGSLVNETLLQIPYDERRHSEQQNRDKYPRLFKLQNSPLYLSETARRSINPATDVYGMTQPRMRIEEQREPGQQITRTTNDNLDVRKEDRRSKEAVKPSYLTPNMIYRSPELIEVEALHDYLTSKQRSNCLMNGDIDFQRILDESLPCEVNQEAATSGVLNGTDPFSRNYRKQVHSDVRMLSNRNDARQEADHLLNHSHSMLNIPLKALENSTPHSQGLPMSILKRNGIRVDYPRACEIPALPSFDSTASHGTNGESSLENNKSLASSSFGSSVCMSESSVNDQKELVIGSSDETDFASHRQHTTSSMAVSFDGSSQKNPLSSSPNLSQEHKQLVSSGIQEQNLCNQGDSRIVLEDFDIMEFGFEDASDLKKHNDGKKVEMELDGCSADDGSNYSVDITEERYTLADRMETMNSNQLVEIAIRSNTKQECARFQGRLQPMTDLQSDWYTEFKNEDFYRNMANKY